MIQNLEDLIYIVSEKEQTLKFLLNSETLQLPVIVIICLSQQQTCTVLCKFFNARKLVIFPTSSQLF